MLQQRELESWDGSSPASPALPGRAGACGYGRVKGSARSVKASFPIAYTPPCVHRAAAAVYHHTPEML